MTEESPTPGPVELARRAIEAADRGDVDALVRTFAPDAVWDWNRLGGLGTFEGHAAIRSVLEDWYANYDELEITLGEILDFGNGVVFFVIMQKGRPVGSSGEVQIRFGTVSLYVEGLCARATQYLDINEARAAAERLAEERAQADV